MVKQKIFAIDEIWTVHETRYYRASSLKEAKKMAGNGDYIRAEPGNFEDFLNIDSIGELTEQEIKDKDLE